MLDSAYVELIVKLIRLDGQPLSINQAKILPGNVISTNQLIVIVLFPAFSTAVVFQATVRGATQSMQLAEAEIGTVGSSLSPWTAHRPDRIWQLP
jgi:hypothetical protein